MDLAEGRPAPLRLLSLNTSVSFGGLERFQLQLALGLAERGHRVSAAGRREGPFLEEAFGRGLPVVEVRANSYAAALPASLALAPRLRREGYDLLHYCLSRDIWIASPAARRAGLAGRIVHSLQMNPGGRLNNPIHRRLRRALGAFVAPTPTTARQAARVWGMREDEVTVIPNFVPLAPFEEPGLADEAAAIRATWALPADALLVGMLARLEPAKGVDLFVAAARRVAERLPGVHFIIAGPVSGGSREWLEGVIAAGRAAGLADRLHLPGQQDRVPAFLRTLDCLVLPSRRETFGLVLVEGMLAGRACVAFAGPGPDFILGGPHLGRLVPREDPEALAEAIAGLLVNPVERERVAGAGRTWARARFSDMAVIGRYEQLFVDLASTPASR